MDKTDIQKLLDIMAALRDPVRGCPWDREQDFRSVAPYTVEEAYEVADAIARGDLGDLRQELGDLLLQVVFHARMAEEQGAFDFADVARGICDKLVRRHPHVFGDERIATADEQTRAWEDHKRRERAALTDGAPAVLAGVARTLPALARAAKLGRRAAGVGFDWPDAAGVLAKVEEERGELAEAMSRGEPAGIEEELGDLLFALANLARHVGADPEEALRRANAKFERRFARLEALVGASGSSWQALGPDGLEGLWREVKAAERAAAR